MSFSMRLIYSFHNYFIKKNFLLNLTEYANGGVICTFPILKGGYCSIQYIKGGIETHPINKRGKVQFAQKKKGHKL